MEMNRCQMLNYIRRINRPKYTKDEIEEIVNKKGINYFNLGISFIGINGENQEEMYEVN